MDSNRIKKLATGVRASLIAEVSARLDRVLAEGSPDRLDMPNEVKGIEAAIKEHGREKVIEANAYTWFNRLCALRFMDANGYTPVGIVTPKGNSTQPEILADAMQGVFDSNLGFDRLVRDRVAGLISGSIPSTNPMEAAYEAILTAVCKHYANPMPYLFKDGGDASRLLMPQGLLSEDSLLRRIVAEMDHKSCESVEVLGWLYQFYIAEKKDEVFASKKKRGAAEIPAATQLFTPNWIVRYMTENSLGRLWMLNNPSSSLKEKMEYYIEGETPSVYLKVYSPEEITVLDPACGSGHILVYAFDLLYSMYEEEGYLPEEIPAMILTKNLFGFEIDQRAAEIAKFALEMKARAKDAKFFERCIDANVTVLDPIRFSEGELEEAGMLAEHTELLEAFAHLDEIGSLYMPGLSDDIFIDNAIKNIQQQSGMYAEATVALLQHMKELNEKLARKFSVVIANPPYMTSKFFSSELSSYLAKHYKIDKFDLCTCFIQRGIDFVEQNSIVSEITMQSWMFEGTYDKFRNYILANCHIDNLLQLGIKAFKDIGNDVVQTCAFSLSKSDNRALSTFIKLDDCKDYYQKIEEFHNPDRSYQVNLSSIAELPGQPLTAYWAGSLIDLWENAKTIEDYGEYTGSQNVTGDNEKYLRLHWEIDPQNIRRDYWVPYAKGGSFRRYYGNLLHVIDWREDARNFYATNKTSNLLNERYWFHKGITYSAVTSRGTGFRYLPEGCVFDKGGASILLNECLEEILALLNSRVASLLFSVLNPSVNLQVRDIKALPIKIEHSDTIAECSRNLISIAKNDWDSKEISLDFSGNPLLELKQPRLVDAIRLRKEHLGSERTRAVDMLGFIDRQFEDIYGVPESLLPELEDRDIPVTMFDEVDEIKSLISYGVGCLFGRYGINLDSYSDDFEIDEDGIIPFLSEVWFEDDIVGQFEKWLAAIYGTTSLRDNINYIESVLGKSLRDYFVNDFYEDHCKLYSAVGTGKRPIYWMFSSPRNSFNALIYCHNYRQGTVGELLTGYLRDFISKLNASIASLETSGRAADQKQADRYRNVVKELEEWERDTIYPMAHERIAIDLDDGVKVNYNKFPHALRKVTGLSEWK